MIRYYFYNYWRYWWIHVRSSLLKVANDTIEATDMRRVILVEQIDYRHGVSQNFDWYLTVYWFRKRLFLFIRKLLFQSEAKSIVWSKLLFVSAVLYYTNTYMQMIRNYIFLLNFLTGNQLWIKSTGIWKWFMKCIHIL